MVVLRRSGLGIDPKLFEDITFAGFRHAVDYLVVYSDELVQDLEGLPNAGSYVKGRQD